MELRSNVAWVVCGLVALGSASGCGTAAEPILLEQLSDLNALAEALERNAPEEEIQAIAERLADSNRQLEALDLSEAQRKELVDKYSEELLTAHSRIGDAMTAHAARAMQNASDEGFGGQPYPVLPVPAPDR